VSPTPTEPTGMYTTAILIKSKGIKHKEINLMNLFLVLVTFRFAKVLRFKIYPFKIRQTLNLNIVAIWRVSKTKNKF
jgi:hypothetical protein